MKKLVLFLMSLFMSNTSYSYDAVIGGIYYNLITKAKEAEVTYGDWNVNIEEGQYNGAIVIPDSIEYNGITYNVISIGKSAFSLCRNLTSVKLPKHLRKIEDGAFSICSKLDSISIPDGVETIGVTAFQFTGLKSLVIPNSVLSIGYMAFVNCENLVSVKLSDSLIKLGTAAFMQCYQLESITLPESLSSMDNSVFMNCTSLISVNIPSSMKSISESAFKGCTSLDSLVIPNGLYTIGSSAFSGCSNLKVVNISSTVTDIYKEAFAECKNLEYVYCNAEQIPYASYDTFRDSYIEFATLYVPESSVDNYRQTEPWMYFKSIETINNSNLENVIISPVLIQYNNGIITINGIEEGTRVSAYTLSGIRESSTISRNGGAILNTSAKSGSTIVVAIGNKSVKVLLK